MTHAVVAALCRGGLIQILARHHRELKLGERAARGPEPGLGIDRLSTAVLAVRGTVFLRLVTPPGLEALACEAKVALGNKTEERNGKPQQTKPGVPSMGAIEFQSRVNVARGWSLARRVGSSKVGRAIKLNDWKASKKGLRTNVWIALSSPLPGCM